jgi:hypothetical protein
VIGRRLVVLEVCVRVMTGDALSRAEMTKAELELEINKVKTEEAGLRDALLKMQSLNEGLGQDKIELNKIIMQVCLCNIYISD